MSHTTEDKSAPPSQPPAETDSSPHTPFALAPPPWETKCDIYWLLSYNRGPLPANAYSPLEASSPTFADATKAGAFKGGLGLVMIIRYSDTPVGSYNEMIYMPGSFEVPRKGLKPAARVTRIYVDQKETTYNGESFIFHTHQSPFWFSTGTFFFEYRTFSVEPS
jgi:hypothetical protein